MARSRDDEAQSKALRQQMKATYAGIQAGAPRELAAPPARAADSDTGKVSSAASQRAPRSDDHRRRHGEGGRRRRRTAHHGLLDVLLPEQVLPMETALDTSRAEGLRTQML